MVDKLRYLKGDFDDELIERMTFIPVVSVTNTEVEVAADIEWGMGNHEDPRPDRPVTKGELLSREDDAEIGPLFQVGDEGAIAGVASSLSRGGLITSDETSKVYGTVRTICCFKLARYVRYESGPLPGPGPAPTPKVPVLTRLPSDCGKMNGKGAQALLENMRYALQIMKATAIYFNQIRDQQIAIECLEKKARGLPGFTG